MMLPSQSQDVDWRDAAIQRTEQAMSDVPRPNPPIQIEEFLPPEAASGAPGYQPPEPCCPRDMKCPTGVEQCAEQNPRETVTITGVVFHTGLGDFVMAPGSEQAPPWTPEPSKTDVSVVVRNPLEYDLYVAVQVTGVGEPRVKSVQLPAGEERTVRFKGVGYDNEVDVRVASAVAGTLAVQVYVSSEDKWSLEDVRAFRAERPEGASKGGGKRPGSDRCVLFFTPGTELCLEWPLLVGAMVGIPAAAVLYDEYM